MWDVLGGLWIYALRYLHFCEMTILDRSALVASPTVCLILSKLVAFWPSVSSTGDTQVGCPRKWHFGIPRNTEVISGAFPAKFRGIPRNFAEFRRNCAEITSEVKKFRGIPCRRNSVDTLHTGRLTKRDKLMKGKCRRGWREAELYGLKKAWSSVNHSILSGLHP